MQRCHALARVPREGDDDWSFTTQHCVRSGTLYDPTTTAAYLFDCSKHGGKSRVCASSARPQTEKSLSFLSCLKASYNRFTEEEAPGGCIIPTARCAPLRCGGHALSSPLLVERRRGPADRSRSRGRG